MDELNDTFEKWYEDHKELIESDALTRKGLARLVWGTAKIEQPEKENDAQLDILRR